MKRRFLILFFLAVLCVLLPSMKLRAEGQTVGNLVILVSFEKDAEGNPLTNEFTSGYGTSSLFYCWSDRVGATAPSGTGIIYFKDIFAAEKSGFPHYIHTVSDGKVTVNSFFPQEAEDGTVTTIILPGSAEDYKGNSGSGGDGPFVEAVISAMQNAAFPTSIDRAQLDSRNGDGCIDNLMILVQADNDGAFTSHEKNYGGTQEVCFGLRVASYNILSTQALRGSGYSVAAHEFMHTLGAPDLYRNSGDGTPVGIWDHMAMVWPIPQYPLTYTRKELGWMDISTVTESGDYTLQPASTSGGDRAYILKTDLSDSEYFVVEYRRSVYGEYDQAVPEDGLVVYRVNEAVASRSNAGGENYIYVFRPGTAANHEDAAEMAPYGNGVRSAVFNAAVGTASRPSLGSGDLSAACTEDTIFYADGSNSGLVIDNVRFNADGTVTFHVAFPELEEEAYWLKLDASIPGAKALSLAKAEAGGVLYMACFTGEYTGSIEVYVNALNGSGWNQLGSSIEAYNGSTPELMYADGKLYLAYLSRNGYPCLRVWDGSGWSEPMTGSEQYARRLQLMEYGSSVWMAYINGNGNSIAVWNPATGERKTSLTVGSATIGNPSVFVYGGDMYAVYADFFANSESAKRGKVAKYSETDGVWKDVYTVSGIGTVAESDVYVDKNKVYAVVTDNSGSFELLTYTPWSGWTEEKLSGVTGSNSVAIEEKDGVPYIVWCDSTVLKAKYKADGVWYDMAGQICADAISFDTICVGGELFVGNTSATGVAVRRMKTVQGGEDEVLGSYDVVLSLPEGYDADGSIYIDGVEFSSAAYQSDSRIRVVSVGNGEAKTAIMYKYNSSGTPTGMYVWRLLYDNEAYLAEAIPEFENLLSYHGFSVRYTGSTGLRCVSGIDVTKKNRLISADGLAGFRLKELGTLVMRPDNREKYPLVYGSKMVSGGRTYYVDGGKTYDKIIRTTNGRQQFANVLIDLHPSRYAMSYVFRSYAVMEYKGSQVVIYGPEMSRSMYTVCKQVLNTGAYPVGSDAYTFLKKIIDTVDAQN